MMLYWFGSGQELWGTTSESLTSGKSRWTLDLLYPSHRWAKPRIDVIKINVDATGIGMIARDCGGFVLGKRVVFLVYDMDVQWAKAEALREGIIWGRNNNIARAIFKTDCAGLVNRFKSYREDISLFGFD